MKCTTKEEDVTFLPGIFSQTGRATGEEIEFLKRTVDAKDHPPKEGSALSPNRRSRPGRGHVPAPGRPATSLEPAPSAAVAERGPPARPQQGELALAIAERIRMRRASSLCTVGHIMDCGGQDEPTSATPKKGRPPKRLQPAFASQGMFDGAWTSRFTAANSPGALNRWNEQRPDPGWYKTQFGMVHERQPNWDFSGRPPHSSLGRGLRARAGGRSAPASPSGDPAPEAAGASREASPQPASEPSSPAAQGSPFLTDVDIEKENPPVAAAARTTKLKDVAVASTRATKRPSGTPSPSMVCVMEQMTLASPRGDLGRIGRVHVLMHEVSYPSEDLLKQDIKGYNKLRYPSWDFSKSQCWPSRGDSTSSHGNYDISYSAVKPRTTGIVRFDRVLPRSVSVTTLGYNAPEAVLHPEEKRAPGAYVKDRSKSKDCIRSRIIHVDEFGKQLDRPPAASANEYHKKNDATAAESVYQFELCYDANEADRWTTHRRDVGPSYAKMLPRGRDAVQGNRALQHDVGVRGSVGIGFVETSGQRTGDTAQRECRQASGVRERPDLGPQFDHYTLFQQTTNENNFNHGYAPVQGSGPKYCPKQSPLCKVPSVFLKQKAPGVSFERKAECGFIARSKLGRSRVAQRSRAHEAMTGAAGDAPEA